MRFLLNKLIIVCFSSILLLMACSGEEVEDNSSNHPKQTANTSEEIAKDDPLELGKMINIPNDPKQITYKEVRLDKMDAENRIPSPNEKKLVVVLKFSPEETEKIIEKAVKYRPAFQSEIDAENWFPAELIAQSQTAGDETLKGYTYAATDFLKTPYTDGKLTRIENTDYLILELVAF